MIAVESCVLVLLAAGRSSRFGEGNKLEADFLGKPVGLHVVTALADMPFLDRVVVTDACTLDFAGHGFRMIRNPDPGRGLSHSVRLGIGRATALAAEAAVIALADMPCITAAHVARLLAAAGGADAVVTSSDGTRPSPPVLFGRNRFAPLMALAGDQGARALIATGHHVVISPSELFDIDTPADLERLSDLVRATDSTVAPPGG